MYVRATCTLLIACVPAALTQVSKAVGGTGNRRMLNASFYFRRIDPRNTAMATAEIAVTIPGRMKL